jgi:hypothetical protein
VILTFPWYDHADWSLAGVRRYWYAPWRKLFVDEFPTTLTDDGWDDLEQGWWGQIVPSGDDVYIAETDFDEILDANDGSGIVVARPGFVFVNGVDLERRDQSSVRAGVAGSDRVLSPRTAITRGRPESGADRESEDRRRLGGVLVLGAGPMMRGSQRDRLVLPLRPNPASEPRAPPAPSRVGARVGVAGRTSCMAASPFPAGGRSTRAALPCLSMSDRDRPRGERVTAARRPREPRFFTRAAGSRPPRR